MILPGGAGRLTATNVTLRLLIQTAYNLQDFQMVGGPPWQTSRRFDINAKAENPAATMQDMLAMLKTLLADRFQLMAHTESREVPIGVLVLARSDGKLGPNLKPSTANCPTPEEQSKQLTEAVAKGGLAAVQSFAMNADPACSIRPTPGSGGAAGMGLRLGGQPMSTLVALLAQFTGKPVQDRTGLTGRFDFELMFDPEVLMRLMSQLGLNVPIGNLPPSNAPALLTALQEQLGLKLENDKGRGEVLVIDRAELPTLD